MPKVNREAIPTIHKAAAPAVALAITVRSWA
jgi:hypothetical protein